jgi:hypothetical protein
MAEHRTFQALDSTSVRTAMAQRLGHGLYGGDVAFLDLAHNPGQAAHR